MTFGLYANERNEAHPVLIQNEVRAALPVPATASQHPQLELLYLRLKNAEIFKVPKDGVILLKTEEFIQISLQSDELYRSGEVAMETTWFSMLDQIGNLLFSNKASVFQFNFIGFANSLNENETRGAAFQESPYLFSSSRAEWLFRYYESKYHLKAGKQVYLISGAGAIPNGKRIEVRITELLQK